jgi:hypothetical protein
VTEAGESRSPSSSSSRTVSSHTIKL